MTMKKEYITPEVEIIEFGLDDGILMSPSIETGGEENDGFARDDNNYDDNTPSRPGSGNVWDQGW